MPAKDWESAEREEDQRIYHEGFRQFNAGDFFEAHEVWEDVWRSAVGKQRLFYQGLIQAAVTLVHLSRGNRRGCLTVYKTCLTKFDGLPAVYMGLEIAPFLEKLRGAIAHVVDDPEAPVRPNPEKRFTAALQYDPFETPRETDVP